jgi:endonuclease/exonuclease/phosphatase family metal-dependent hydrolase
MEVLRVVTFNLLSPEHADWPSRRTVIEAELRRLRPDLVALQECVRDTGGRLPRRVGSRATPTFPDTPSPPTTR